MFAQLKAIHARPQPFAFYTTDILWDDPHISKNMLAYHLNETVDAASRNKAFVDRSIEWIAAHFSLGAHSHICDFGCGPGLYTLGLALKGAQVTGVDFSRSSIAYARQEARTHGVDIHYVLENYLQVETEERYDLITMIMCDFCALSPAHRKLLLNKFRSLLKAGGAVLLDAYTLKAFDQRTESSVYAYRQMDGFWSAEDYYGFVNVFKYPEEKVVLDQYTIVEERRTWQVYNWLQYFSLPAMAQEFEACGLYIAERYSNVAGAPYAQDTEEFAVVGRAASER